MTELEKKEKRWKFLNELFNRDVETVSPQIGRLADEIMLIKIEQYLIQKRKDRDSKLEKVLKNEVF